jgi:hypothetical protein
MELPEDIEAFFEDGFQTTAESVGQALVDFLLYAQKNIKKISQICLDYFISDRCHMSIDIDQNHISLRPVHSLDAYSDLDPYKDVQDNHEFFFESYWLSQNEIFNKFPNLDDNKKKKIKEIFKNLGLPGTETESNTHKNELTHSYKYGQWYRTDNKVNRIRCVYARWKSKKVLRWKKSFNKKYKKYHWKKLPDDYQVKEKDEKNIDYLTPDVQRYCVSVGPDICLEYGIDEYRLSSEDNLLETKLDVVSLVRENYSGSSTIKSIAASLYHLQNMASEILFELRFALKKAGNDRVLVYDTAQTPKELNKGSVTNALKKVNDHIKRDAIMYINSKQKGSKNSFNQFTSLDISQTKGIKILIDSLAIIEQLADRFTSIPQERSGDVPVHQTATATEVAIGGSSSKNEILFQPLDHFFAEVIMRMLQKSKLFYNENQIIQYVIGDNKTKFLKLYKEFFDADLGCYFGDPGKDLRLQQMIDQAAQMSMASANTPEVILGLIDVMEGDTASEKKAMFQKMLDKMEEMRQENIAAEQKQAEEQTKQAQIAQQQKDKEHKEKMQNNIDVANIYANNKAYGDNLKATTTKEVAEMNNNTKLASEANKSKEKAPAEA